MGLGLGLVLRVCVRVRSCGRAWARGDIGKYREIQGDIGRCREIGRRREIQGDIGSYTYMGSGMRSSMYSV